MIAVVPRLALRLSGAGFAVGGAWRDTAVDLPPHLADVAWRNALTGDAIEPGPGASLALERVLRACPVALLAGTARAGA